jgi:hypothetical protein
MLTEDAWHTSCKLIENKIKRRTPMKKQLIAAIAALIIATVACSIQNVEMKTVEPRTVTIAEALPGNTEETEIAFQMTGGTFTIVPGAQGLVDGSITYNVEQWEPEFTRRENYLRIKQTSPFKISGIPTGDTTNNWDLALTTAKPLNLKIEGAASKNSFDFSGLQLVNLNIIQGASETTISFNTLNPLILETFSFTTGASKAELFNLTNANFRNMTFSSGAGDYTLDFNGILLQDATVDIKAGASNIEIVIPAGMKAQINNQSKVTNINTSGTWLLSNETYQTLEEGFTLTINLDIGFGNVKLVHEELP